MKRDRERPAFTHMKDNRSRMATLQPTKGAAAVRFEKLNCAHARVLECAHAAPAWGRAEPRAAQRTRLQRAAARRVDANTAGAAARSKPSVSGHREHCQARGKPACAREGAFEASVVEVQFGECGEFG